MVDIGSQCYSSCGKAGLLCRPIFPEGGGTIMARPASGLSLLNNALIWIRSSGVLVITALGPVPVLQSLPTVKTCTWAAAGFTRYQTRGVQLNCWSTVFHAGPPTSSIRDFLDTPNKKFDCQTVKFLLAISLLFCRQFYSKISQNVHLSRLLSTYKDHGIKVYFFLII